MSRLRPKKPLGWRALTDVLRAWNADLLIGKGSQAATRESVVPSSSWLNQTYKRRWGGAFAKAAALVLAGFLLLPSASPGAVPPLPDFAIESVALDPPVPVEDMLMTVTVTVTNRGDAGGDARFLDIWFDRPQANPPVRGDVGDWWGKVGWLEAGESVSITSPPIYQPASGSFHLCAHIEFESIVSETTKTNNHFCLDYEAASLSSMLRPVYRFYSPIFKGHFFTISDSEKANVIENLSRSWNYEGIAYQAYQVQARGTVPLYRFYSKKFKGHFFTINEEERDSVIANLSQTWNYEGIAYYVYPEQVTDALPVHRFWSPAYKHHFYTINQEEKEFVMATYTNSWHYEGIEFYALVVLEEEEDIEKGNLGSYGFMERPQKHGGSEEGENFTVSEFGSPNVSVSSGDSSVSESRRLIASSWQAQEQGVIIGLGFMADDGEEMLDGYLYGPDGEVRELMPGQMALADRTVQVESDSVLDSPTFVSTPGLFPDTPYWLEIWSGIADDGGIMFSGWLGNYSQLSEITFDIFDEAITSGLHPVVTIAMPSGIGLDTLAIYSPFGDEITAVGPVAGGETAILELPERLGYYMLIGADAEGEVVLSRWILFLEE